MVESAWQWSVNSDGKWGQSRECGDIGWDEQDVTLGLVASSQKGLARTRKRKDQSPERAEEGTPDHGSWPSAGVIARMVSASQFIFRIVDRQKKEPSDRSEGSC